MTAQQIAHELHGRRSGAGWTAKCPAHEDKNPSLSITEKDGRLLVHCFSGCPQTDVIEALRKLGLWPEVERPELTPAERKEWGRRRRAAEQSANRVYNWYYGAGLRLADVKLDADLEGDIPTLAAASRALYELEQADAAELTRMYEVAEPGLRAHDELAGWSWRRLCEQVCAAVVTRPERQVDDDSIAAV